MSDKLPPEIQDTIAAMADHIMAAALRPIAAALRPITRIPVYCNVCEHEIVPSENAGEWKCVRKPSCRCMMIGCVPKVWDDAN